MLQTHYRQPIDWTQRLAEARWQSRQLFAADRGHRAALSCAADAFDALADDLNTPRAIAELHELHTGAKGAKPAAARLKATRSLALVAKSTRTLNGFEPAVKSRRRTAN